MEYGRLTVYLMVTWVLLLIELVGFFSGVTLFLPMWNLFRKPNYSIIRTTFHFDLQCHFGTVQRPCTWLYSLLTRTSGRDI